MIHTKGTPFPQTYKDKAKYVPAKKYFATFANLLGNSETFTTVYVVTLSFPNEILNFRSL